MKTITITINESTINGYDGAFLNYIDSDGNICAGGIWDVWFEGDASDEDGNTYAVYWELTEDAKELEANNELDDLSTACEWDKPYMVIDEDGKNVTDSVILEV